MVKAWNSDGWSSVSRGPYRFPSLLLAQTLGPVAWSGLVCRTEMAPGTCAQRLTRKIKQPAFPGIYGSEAHH